MTVAEEKTPDELANDITTGMPGDAEANIPKKGLKTNLWISKKTLDLIEEPKELKKWGDQSANDRECYRLEHKDAKRSC